MASLMTPETATWLESYSDYRSGVAEVTYLPGRATSVPPAVILGDTVTASWTVKNVSATTSITGTWHDRWYLSSDNPWDASDLQVGNFDHQLVDDGGVAPVDVGEGEPDVLQAGMGGVCVEMGGGIYL